MNEINKLHFINHKTLRRVFIQALKFDKVL